MDIKKYVEECAVVHNPYTGLTDAHYIFMNACLSMLEEMGGLLIGDMEVYLDAVSEGVDDTIARVVSWEEMGDDDMGALTNEQRMLIKDILAVLINHA